MKNKSGIKCTCTFEEVLDFVDIDYTRLNKTIRYEQRPHGDPRDRLKEVFREYSEIGGDLFHLSQIENIIDGEVWLEEEGEQNDEVR